MNKKEFFMKEKIILLLTALFITTIIPKQIMAGICLTKGTNMNNLDYQKDTITGVPLNVWVHTDNAVAFDCFQNTNDTNIVNNLEITKRYRVVRQNYRVKKGREYWSLLVDCDAEAVTKETIVGWVSHNYLLTHTLPLKHKDTGIYQKALIKEPDSQDQRALRVYTHPSEDYFRKNNNGKQEGIEVRTVYYVYDFHPKKAREPKSKDTKRLLICADNELNSTDEKANLLIGWVDRAKVSFWDTRTACEFKLGKSPKVIDFDEEGKVVDVFQSNQIITPLEYDELRNPIFEDKGYRYRIGAFARLDKDQLGLQRGVKNIETGLEVLFVIDGTRSMTDVFKATLSAVREIANSLVAKAKEAGTEIPGFALLFYRDIATLNDAIKKVKGNNVVTNEKYCKDESILYQMGSINRFTRYLDSHIACDADKTVEESMYKGIIDGLNQCQFETGNDGLPKNTRIVIHIGDAGDNGSGNYSSRDVSRALKKHHIFKYISVNSGQSIGFTRSVKKLSPGPGKAKHIDRLSDMKKTVIAQLNFSQRQSIKIKKQIQIISRGFAGSNQGRIGVISPEILEYAKKIIEANGIKSEEIDAFQQYYEGWVDKEKVKEYILVSRTDIEDITKFLNDMTNQFDDNYKRRQAWEKALEMILGDQSCEIDDQPIPLNECNEMRKGIPIKAGFMKFTRQQFLNLSSQHAAQVRCQAKMSREQFRAFLQNKYISSFNLQSSSPCVFNPQYNYDINGDEKVNAPYDNNKNDKLLDKYFFSEGEEQMAWIPIKHFDIKQEDR